MKKIVTLLVVMCVCFFSESKAQKIYYHSANLSAGFNPELNAFAGYTARFNIINDYSSSLSIRVNPMLGIRPYSSEENSLNGKSGIGYMEMLLPVTIDYNSGFYATEVAVDNLGYTLGVGCSRLGIWEPNGVSSQQYGAYAHAGLYFPLNYSHAVGLKAFGMYSFGENDHPMYGFSIVMPIGYNQY